jgi:hypothetical protein
MDDINARLEQLQAQNSAANIPALAKKQKMSDLYTEMLASKENKESAPERYKNAYKAYYVYAEGREAYRERVKAKAIEKMVAFNAKTLRELEEFVAECQRSIDELQGLTDYANNLQDVYAKMLMKLMDKKNVQRLTNDIQNTTNRKTFYLNNSLARIMTWNTVFNALLVSLALTFLLKAFQDGNIKTPVVGRGRDIDCELHPRAHFNMVSKFVDTAVEFQRMDAVGKKWPLGRCKLIG